MKKRILSSLLAFVMLLSALPMGVYAAETRYPVAASPDQTTDVGKTVSMSVSVSGGKYNAYDLALKLEDIRSNETLGYRTAGSDAELATGDMLKAEMERIGLQNVTKDAFTLDTQDSLFGLSRRCIPSWVSRAHPSPARGMQHP